MKIVVAAWCYGAICIGAALLASEGSKSSARFPRADLIGAICTDTGVTSPGKTRCTDVAIFVRIGIKDTQYWRSGRGPLRVFRVRPKTGDVGVVTLGPQREIPGYRPHGEPFGVSRIIDIDDNGELWALSIYDKEGTYPDAESLYLVQRFVFAPTVESKGESTESYPVQEISVEARGSLACRWQCEDMDVNQGKIFLTNKYDRIIEITADTGGIREINVNQPYRTRGGTEPEPSTERVLFLPQIAFEFTVSEYLLAYSSEAGAFLYERNRADDRGFVQKACLSVPPEAIASPTERVRLLGCDHELFYWGWSVDSPPILQLSREPALFYLKPGSELIPGEWGIWKYSFYRKEFTLYSLRIPVREVAVSGSAYTEGLGTPLIPRDFRVLQDPSGDLPDAGLIVLADGDDSSSQNHSVVYYVFPSTDLAQLDPDENWGKKRLAFHYCTEQITLVFEPGPSQTVRPAARMSPCGVIDANGS
jgi:hypothetical protein